jgi:hypothetical protein
MWDTAIFTLKNPYFLKHLIRLGSEMIPFYKIPLPWKKSRKGQAKDGLSKCPSAPTVDYAQRSDVPCGDE